MRGGALAREMDSRDGTKKVRREKMSARRGGPAVYQSLLRIIESSAPCA
jgi:hypothetical protein